MDNRIGVKIYGAADEHVGFTAPLLTINQPKFQIKDDTYPGLDKCAFFFSVKILHSQTIYKLVVSKSRVRSCGGQRDAALVIGMSIPRGYKIDQGYNAYNVLIKLKDAFIEKGMTCRDSGKGIYEFKQKTYEQHVLDDVIDGFALVEDNGPYREMSENGMQACIVLSPDKIREFFSDIQYPEFSQYGEIIVAESLSNDGGYAPLQIQVPRQVHYELIVDGKSWGLKDKDEQIMVIGGRNPNYYDNKSITFKISELLSGEKTFPDIVEIDEKEECIRVNTNSLNTPKTVQVRVVFNNYGNEFRSKRNNWKLLYNNTEIQLDNNNLTFPLKGENLADLSNPGIFNVVICNNNKFSFQIIKTTVTPEGQINVDVEKINQGGAKTNPVNYPVATIEKDVIHLYLNFQETSPKEGKFADGYTKVIRVKKEIGDYTKTIVSQRVEFRGEESGMKSARLQLPYTWLNDKVTIEFGNKKNKYSSELVLSQDAITLNDNSFKKKKIGFLTRHKIGFLATCLSILMFISGLAAGIFADRHEPVKDWFSGEPVDTTICDTDSVVMTLEEAIIILGNLDDQLRSGDKLTFEAVDSVYKKYVENRALFEEADTIYRDKDNTNPQKGQMIARLKAYNDVICAIKEGNNDMINTLLNRNIRIYKNHKERVRIILTDNETIKAFKNLYSEFTCFGDLKKIKKVIPSSDSNGGTSGKVVSNTTGSSGNNSSGQTINADGER